VADLPVVARLYTQGRYRRASVKNGPGQSLVLKADADAEIRALKNLLSQAVPLLREVAAGYQCGQAAGALLREFNSAIDGVGGPEHG
jgi:hypothetical protein